MVLVVYDPKKISYETLLKTFWESHDPTQGMRQGNDIGTQYRSAIFYTSEDEKRFAEAKIHALNEKHAFPRPIVTTLEPLGEFYPAEDYHQDSARLNPDQSYIQAVSIPKVCKVRAKHPTLIRQNQ